MKNAKKWRYAAYITVAIYFGVPIFAELAVSLGYLNAEKTDRFVNGWIVLLGPLTAMFFYFYFRWSTGWRGK